MRCVVIGLGRIGCPLTSKAVGRHPDCPPLDYANPAHSGGLILDMGIHDFDLARWLMSSEVARVSAAGALLMCEHFAQVGDIDNAIINLRPIGAAYRSQIEHLVACVEQQRQPAVGGADALAAFEIGLAARRSSQTGRSVAVSDVREPVTA